MRKKIPIFLTALLCVSCLSGCFPTGEPINVSAPSVSSGVSNSSGQKQANSSKIPASVKKQLADNLYIAASVSVSTNANWKNYQAKLKNWDVNLATQQFFSNKQVGKKEEYADPNHTNQKNITITGKDGSTLAVQLGSINFEEKNYKDFYYATYLHDITAFNGVNDSKLFSKPTLDNINKEQAIALVKEKAKALGIAIEENPSVIAMDVDSLNDPKYNDPVFFADKKIKQHHWVKQDQAYAVIFRALQNEQPITRSGYYTSSEYAAGTRLMGVVGTKGLLSFSVGSTYETTGTPQPVNNLISLDTVLERIKDKYKNVILTDPVTVYKINLEYVPVSVDAKNNKFTLLPMWVCLTEQTVTMNGEKGKDRVKSQFPIYYNAATGQEMEIKGII